MPAAVCSLPEGEADVALVRAAIIDSPTASSVAV